MLFNVSLYNITPPFAESGTSLHYKDYISISALKCLVYYHLVVQYVEGVGNGTGLGLDIDTIVLVHGPLAKDDAVEGLVEADLHFHVGLAAHDLEAGNVGHVPRPLNVPEVDVVGRLLCAPRQHQRHHHQ